MATFNNPTQTSLTDTDDLDTEEATQERTEILAAIAEALQEVEDGKDRPFEEFVAQWEAFWRTRGTEGR